ncbi:hypothetical protein MYX76_05325 [Desulfobacterota bacterium AH_259_B03_O07]|nr:hypothetical protein [Desulfobacterota bacterium AH_259_B03_O07]
MFPVQDDTFEVSVFGTGFGECVLVHIGNNDWIVVDACLDPSTKTPCVLEYFSSIGVDPAKAIKLVIATHWDTDHVEGLAEILRVSEESEFVMSKALKNEDFRRFVFAMPDIPGVPKTSTKEFFEIFKICAERAAKRTLGAITLASENQTLIRDEINIGGKDVEREVIALSPSSAAQLKSLEGFSKLMANEFEPVRNLRQLENNHTSIVLWVKVGSINILLGADLEELGVPDDGWQRILNNQKLPRGSKSEMFKIPHHGSENGHHAGVWSDLVVDDNFSVVTPFQHGHHNLPTNSDLRRISSYSQKAYIAGGTVPASLRKDKERKNLLRKVNKNLQRKRRELGHVIMQKKIVPPSDWSVDCIGVCKKI